MLSVKLKGFNMAERDSLTYEDKEDRKESKSKKTTTQIIINNINITNNNIHASGIKNFQVGSHNLMRVNNGGSQAENKSGNHGNINLDSRQRKRLDKLLEMTDEVHPMLIIELSNHIGRTWRTYGRRLGFTDDDLEQIYLNYNQEGLREVIYQALIKWKNETEDPSVKNLVTLLIDGDDYKPIMFLLESQKHK